MHRWTKDYGCYKYSSFVCNYSQDYSNIVDGYALSIRTSSCSLEAFLLLIQARHKYSSFVCTCNQDYSNTVDRYALSIRTSRCTLACWILDDFLDLIQTRHK
ncbi:hypothetical protein AVEN_88758-1 [Araneus ventricosus]|uniref:Uncharacterized protein n=1 Tax=Araneus ventricosus TaxID=182803 RepID=A0A4Y2FBP0_ARAVE|nr:hypothetical protein AVEN_88758-1 [Araneus ventricosus]